MHYSRMRNIFVDSGMARVKEGGHFFGEAVFQKCPKLVLQVLAGLNAAIDDIDIAEPVIEGEAAAGIAIVLVTFD